MLWNIFHLTDSCCILLQMTGLNVEKETIMEAAVLVTDSELNVVAEGPNIALKVEDSLLDNMNDWCKEHHGKVIF